MFSVLTPFQLREISDYRNNTMYLDTVIFLLLYLRLRVQRNFEYDPFDVAGRMKRKFRNGKTWQILIILKEQCGRGVNCAFLMTRALPYGLDNLICRVIL